MNRVKRATKEGKMEPKAIVVLCVDKDDDVGLKTGIATPIVGRENVFKAAVELISKDPAEADANTMFESIKIFDSLLSEEEGQVEIAVVAGSSDGDLKASRKISKEIQEVVGSFPAEAAILVSDGFSDQEVAPIIQSHVPIISIHRFAVRHSRTLETTWFILIKYIQDFLKEPRNARWFLGIPGLTILILTAMSIAGLLFQLDLMPLVTTSIAVIIGAALFVRGFSFDILVSSVIAEIVDHPSVLTKVFGTITGILVCLLGFQQGLSAAIASAPLIQFDLAMFLKIATIYSTFGGSVILVGRAAYYFFEKSVKFWSYCMGVVATAMIGGILVLATEINNFGNVDFFMWIALSVFIMIISTLILGRLKKRYTQFLPQFSIVRNLLGVPQLQSVVGDAKVGERFQ